jgi:hypothetical protein
MPPKTRKATNSGQSSSGAQPALTTPAGGDWDMLIVPPPMGATSVNELNVIEWVRAITSQGGIPGI